MGDELAGQFVEQFGMARQVLLAGGVHGVDQTDTEEIGEHAVDDGPREIGIVRAGQPAGNQGLRIDAGLPLRGGAVQEAGFNDALFSCRRGSGFWLPPWALRLLKKAAYCQNWDRVQLPPERSSWHWAHSRRMPRNSREVLLAIVSALFSLVLVIVLLRGQ